jgi:hypothetical protein
VVVSTVRNGGSRRPRDRRRRGFGMSWRKPDRHLRREGRLRPAAVSGCSVMFLGRVLAGESGPGGSRSDRRAALPLRPGLWAATTCLGGARSAQCFQGHGREPAVSCGPRRTLVHGQAEGQT